MTPATPALGARFTRSLRVSEAQYDACIASVGHTSSTAHVTAATIAAMAAQSGDSSIWHDVPGAAYRESSLLRARMTESGIAPRARLGHGATALVLALRTAYAERRQLSVQHLRDIRYRAPVFEGAILTASHSWTGHTSACTVRSNGLADQVVLTGAIDFAPQAGSPDDALFTMEACIGLVSQLLGLGMEERGFRVLYMGQDLRRLALISVDDALEAAGTVLDVQPGKRVGTRLRMHVDVSATGLPIAEGTSTILLMNPYE